MNRLLTDDVRAALTAGRLAHLVTINPDGGPQTYLGPSVRFPPMDNPPPGHVIHISVDRIGGVGPWTSDRDGEATR